MKKQTKENLQIVMIRWEMGGGCMHLSGANAEASFVPCLVTNNKDSTVIDRNGVFSPSSIAGCKQKNGKRHEQ